MDILKPSTTLLIKLGSLIVHYDEFTSHKGHEIDKTTIDSLLKDPEVKEWMEKMNEAALLPIKR